MYEEIVKLRKGDSFRQEQTTQKGATMFKAKKSIYPNSSSNAAMRNKRAFSGPRSHGKR